MFTQIVFYFLMALLILSSGTALHMGVFKSRREGIGFGRKWVTGVLSYGASTFVWLLLYSNHYLGW